MSCYIDPNGTLSWDVLLPYVVPYVRGVPPDIALHHIRLAAIEFCRRSGILHDVQLYNLQAHVDEYQLTTDCNYEIVRVFRVTVNKRWDYTPVNEKPLNNIGAYIYYMSSPTMISVRQPSQMDNPKGLEVETIVQPKQDSCVLDNYLYQFWSEGIAAGAIQRILTIPQTNWYDPKLAMNFALTFRKELNRCRVAINKTFSGSSVMKAQLWVGPGNNRGWNGGYNPNGW